MRRLSVLVAGVLTLAGCIDLSVPDDVIVRCTSTAECPSGLVCRTDANVCVLADEQAAPFPTVTSVFILPATARPGATVRLSFRIEGEHQGEPAATLDDGLRGAAGDRLALDRAPDEDGVYVFSRELPPDVADGQYDVVVTLQDSYGVEGEVVAGTLLVDGSPPELLAPASVLPGVAGPGATAIVRLVVSEPLTEQVVLDVDDGVAITTLPALNNEAGVVTFAVDVPFDTTAEQFTFTIRDLVDLAGNSTPGPLAAGTLLIDATPPSLTEVSLNRSRYSTVEGFNDIELTFRAQGAASTSAEVFGRALDCGVDDDDTIRCTTTVGTLDPAGTQDVVVRAIDEVGNPSSAFVSFIVDTAPPQVVESSLDVRLSPGPDNPLDTVDAVAAGTTVRVTFTADEPLGAAPLLGPGGDGTFALTESVGQTSTFEWTFGGELPDGPLVLAAVLVDEVGNTQTASLGAAGTLQLDTVAPPTPRTDLDRAIVMTRRPWGGTDGDGVLTQVVGAPDAAPGADAVVLVTGGGEVLGQSAVGTDGSFVPVVVPGVDLKTVAVSSVDSAGNRSPSAAVRDIELVATLNGREPDSDTNNPHQLRAVRDLLDALAQPDTEKEIEGQRVALDDGEREVVASSSAWRRPGSTGRPPFPNGAAAWDSIRGRSVVLSGVLNTSNDVVAYRHDEWGGAGWASLAQVLDFLPNRRVNAALGFDDRVGRVVLATGRGSRDELLNDTWVFENNVWTPLLDGTAIDRRELAAMAFDTHRGVMVLFGGHDGGSALDETWELGDDGWVLRDDVGGPGPRAGHALVYDPVRQALVLVGGDSGFGVSADLWSYDGESWTPIPFLSEGAPLPPLDAPIAAWDWERDELFITATGTFDAWTVGDDTVTYHPDSVDLIPLPGLKGIIPTGGAPLLYYGFATFRWNGSSLEDITRRSPGGTGRGLHAMTFDRGRNHTVLFGGYGSAAEPYVGTRPDDVYTWTEADGWVVPEDQGAGPDGRPAWRSGHAMVFDATHDEVVMFGGFLSRNDGAGNTVFANDTWLWNGTSWTRAEAGGDGSAPSPRSDHKMVFDSALGQVVLFGGLSPEAEVLTDMWRWDGTGWTEVPSPALKPIVRGFDMVYDVAREQIVLFGGEILIEGSKPLTTSDLWLYNANGNVWERRIDIPDPELDGQPIPRAYHRMVYDEVSHETQMFGGLETTNYESAIPSVPDAWAFNGTSWRRLDVGNSEALKVPSYLLNYGLTWDTVNNSVLMIGDENIWTVSAAGQRPAAVAAFFVGDVLQAGAAVDLDVSAVAGGAGGVDLLVWERPGVWRTLDTVDAPPGMPEALSGVAPVASAHLVNERIHVAVRARAESSATLPSRVEVDALELRFRYTLDTP
jgi:hypothetical protein